MPPKGWKKPIQAETSVATPTIPVETKVEVKEILTTRTADVIEKELAEAKAKLVANTVVDNISVGRDYDTESDRYSVPNQIQKAYPEMNFHWVRTESDKISGALDKRYQIVHIPASCKDLLMVYKARPKSWLTDAYGDDVLTRGTGLILMMCPKEYHKARKQKLEDLRKSRTQNEILSNTDLLRNQLGSNVKGVNISVTD